MQEQTLISIIIPTFNRKAYVVDAIESVIYQGFNNTEIIVIDDGSTDDTEGVLKPYSWIVRYIYQTNRGVSAARNLGVRESRGELIAFLDSDDIWLRGKLKAQIDRVLSEDVLSFEGVEWFVDREENAALLGRSEGVKWPLCDKYGYVRDPVLDVAEGRYFHLGTLLCRKKTFLEVGFFDERLCMGEDEDWFGRAALIKRFHYCSKPFLKRRFHLKQTASESEACIRSLISVFSQMRSRTKRVHPKASEIASKRLAAKWSHLSNKLVRQDRRVEAIGAAKAAYALSPRNIGRLIKLMLLSMQWSMGAALIRNLPHR